MVRYWVTQIQHEGRRWSGRGSVTPDAWVTVDSAYGYRTEILSDDESPEEQAKRLLREIVEARHA